MTLSVEHYQELAKQHLAQFRHNNPAADSSVVIEVATRIIAMESVQHVEQRTRADQLEEQVLEFQLLLSEKEESVKYLQALLGGCNDHVKSVFELLMRAEGREEKLEELLFELQLKDDKG